MIIKDALKKGTQTLEDAGIKTAPLDAEVLLMHTLNAPRTKLLAHPKRKLTKKQASRFDSLIKKRKIHIPIAYLTSEKEFYGLKIIVSQDVLIPRPETETIIEYAKNVIKKDTKNKKHYCIADVGTGSGAIAVTLGKLFPKTTIIASDISKKVLSVVKANLDKHTVSNVTILLSDLLKKYPKDLKINTVIANLPYLSEDVYLDVQPEIHYEPKEALVAKNYGLYFYEELIESLEPFIDKKMLLFLEIDPHQYTALKKLITKKYPKTKIAPIEALSSPKRKNAKKIKIGLAATIVR
ncbi:peptide chain release factor N(5)-glutamine methyltransferase [Patescibacteria group bacterium]|nr:peptide chain release factor N(5)-glutamine methyltransferase [Patescibacteria group bacterium]